MTGSWIFICGPSGVGKDSVIAWSRDALSGQADIVFTRRLVTRPAQPGSDHEAIDKSSFLSLQRSGRLRWHWQAHDFHYGISQDYEADVNAGRVVIVNGSRSHANSLPAAPEVKRVEITASPERVAARLAQRGRDSQDALVQRLARNAEIGQITTSPVDLNISNDAGIADAGALLVAYLIAQATESRLLSSTAA